MDLIQNIETVRFHSKIGEGWWEVAGGRGRIGGRGIVGGTGGGGRVLVA